MAEQQDRDNKPKTVTLVDPVTRQKVEEPAPGPNAQTEVDEDHYFLSTDGRKINAFGEEIGSAEEKKRRASL